MSSIRRASRRWAGGRFLVEWWSQRFVISDEHFGFSKDVSGVRKLGDMSQDSRGCPKRRNGAGGFILCIGVG